MQIEELPIPFSVLSHEDQLRWMAARPQIGKRLVREFSRKHPDYFKVIGVEPTSKVRPNVIGFEALQGIKVSLLLKEVLAVRGISRPTDQLLQSWGMSRARFYSVINAEKQIRIDELARIAICFNIPVDALLSVELVGAEPKAPEFDRAALEAKLTKRYNFKQA